MKILITAGPTREKIDPVRFISNYSSGKQGYTIAETFAKRGHEVVLISGPVSILPPKNVKLIEVESAEQMLSACQQALPADIAIFTAAVCDWQSASINKNKIKKQQDINTLSIELVKTPDILKTIASSENRPKIVVGFAAETENLLSNARKKLLAKNADFIIANNVDEQSGTFGGDNNQVTIISASGEEQLPPMPKQDVAEKIADRILIS